MRAKWTKSVGALGLLVWGSFLATNCRADLYGVTYSGNQLIKINEATGAGTLVGPLSNGMTALDLAASGGNLYTFDQINDKVRQLDPTTGATLATIDIGIVTGGEGGFAMRDDGTGFLSSTVGGTGTLWQFDITVPNSSPVTASNGFLPSMDGLAIDSAGVLFGLSQGATDGGNKLYTINQTTGTTTLVGALGVGTSAIGGLAFAPDGTLYATLSDVTPAAAKLYTVDTSSGAATFVGNLGFNSVSGITFLTPVPEPESWMLMLCGSAIVLMRARRKSLR
jgi:hypothetical protein